MKKNIALFYPLNEITESGDYEFRVTLTKDGMIKTSTNKIYFDKILKKGWPYHSYEFDNYVIDGCLKIIPYIEDQDKIMPIGTALYLSPRVKRSMFSQLYILEKESNNIKLAYETPGTPLAVYRGRIIGPLKIWKINYPEYIKVNSTYLSTSHPDPAVENPVQGY